MVALRFDVRADYTKMGKLARNMETRVEKAVLAALYDVWQESVRIILATRYDKGTLAGSIAVEPTGTLSGKVVAGAEHAVYQHEGFVHHKSGQFVKGEPWFDKAAAKAWPKFLKNIERALGV